MTATPEDPSPPLEDPGQLSGLTETAAGAILRRIERIAVGFGVLGVVFWLVLVGSIDGLSILTLTVVVSIVSFRGLQRFVAGFGTRGGGKTVRRTQWRAGLRFGIVLLLPAASLWLNAQQALALIAGFSALPLALISAAFVQFFLADRSESQDGI